MLNDDYVKHDVMFIFDLLVLGIGMANEKREHETKLSLRAALTVTEMLIRNIERQTKGEAA